MAKDAVYVENSIISYLTGRPSRDLIVAARQQTTREWWDRRRGRFDLFVSQFVVKEASDGDKEAAQKRLGLLAGIPLLEATPEVIALAEALVTERALPRTAATDAVHIAFTTVHGVDFLLTWNCKHLANANIMRKVARVLRAHGYEPPIICTPDELMED